MTLLDHGAGTAVLRACTVLFACAALLACAALAACDASGRRTGRSTGGDRAPIDTSAPVRTGPVSTAGWGPAPPARGAWLGAWVNSGDHTRDGRVAAVENFETLIGRPLTIAHVFHGWDDPFPGAADLSFVAQGKLLLLSWSGADTREIVSGVYDPLIRARAEAVRSLGVPILLRFRWEMDRPNLREQVHSPVDYIAAWKHVRGIFAAAGATNAGWVWCPLATGFTDGRAQSYYPGDDQVDWVCADAYAGREMRRFAEVMAPFMRWAARRPRPVMLGEFGVTEGRPGEKAAWFRDARSYVLAYPQVRGLVYFSARQDGKQGYDFTVDSSAAALHAFRELVGEPRLRASPPHGLR
jgi:hypothetical protein